MTSDVLQQVIKQTVLGIFGDDQLTTQHLAAIPPDPPWDPLSGSGTLRVPPGRNPIDFIIRERPCHPLYRALFTCMIEEYRSYSHAYPYHDPLQDVCLWVEGHDLLMQYEPKTPDDLSMYRTFPPSAPFYPSDTCLTGELLVVGTDAERWLSTGLSLYQEQYGGNPPSISTLLENALRANYYFEVDQPPPPVPVPTLILDGRQAVIY